VAGALVATVGAAEPGALGWLRMIYERQQAGAKNPGAWWEDEPPAGPRA
jgi:hypothetical protein